jgi:glycerophosphoryl diester phosphodiesterase
LAFAHRGGASEAPENTLPAFQYAVDLGFRYLETDVHVTADGVLVAFHDHALDRVTDAVGEVSALPWRVVREAKVDGREPIPLLEDLLGAFPEVRVNIDPKHDAAVDPLAEVLRRTGAAHRVCVGAFSDRRLARIRALVPGVCTSLGPKGVARLRAAAAGLPAGGRLPAPCAQVPVRAGRVTIVDDRFLDVAAKRSIDVHVWTIDDAQEMHRLLDLGVQGIMTDRPLVLREVFAERGLAL